MEITQLIELVYWMLIVFCALFGVAFIIALVVIIKGWGTFKKEVLLKNIHPRSHWDKEEQKQKLLLNGKMHLDQHWLLQDLPYPKKREDF